MLKLLSVIIQWFFMDQPPSGGCVLKLAEKNSRRFVEAQPPSGGCVLKLIILEKLHPQIPSRLQAAVC